MKNITLYTIENVLYTHHSELVRFIHLGTVGPKALVIPVERTAFGVWLPADTSCSRRSVLKRLDMDLPVYITKPDLLKASSDTINGDQRPDLHRIWLTASSFMGASEEYGPWRLTAQRMAKRCGQSSDAWIFAAGNSIEAENPGEHYRTAFLALQTSVQMWIEGVCWKAVSSLKDGDYLLHKDIETQQNAVHGRLRFLGLSEGIRPETGKHILAQPMMLFQDASYHNVEEIARFYIPVSDQNYGNLMREYHGREIYLRKSRARLEALETMVQQDQKWLEQEEALQSDVSAPLLDSTRKHLNRTTALLKEAQNTVLQAQNLFNETAENIKNITKSMMPANS